MTQQILPSGGGSYERLGDGSLKVVDQPTAAHDTTTDVVAQIGPTDAPDEGPVDGPKPKAGRTAPAALKEA